MTPSHDGTVGRSGSSPERPIGAFLAALPPVLIIIGFIGFPIVLSFGLTIGFTGGLNEIIALIGQGVHKADHWWGTFAGYRALFDDPRFAGDLSETLVVTVASTCLVLVLALTIGLLVRLHGGWLTKLLSSLVVVPMFVPVVISAWAIHTFYGGDGFIRTVASLIGRDAPTLTSTVWAVVIGSVWTALPFASLMVTSGLQSVPDALIESARDAGASLPHVIRTVLIPLAATPIIIATSFTAIGILGSFTIPYFLGANQPTLLGVEISNFFSAYNRPQQAVAMAFVVFAFAAGIAAAYVWANMKDSAKGARR